MVTLGGLAFFGTLAVFSHGAASALFIALALLAVLVDCPRGRRGTENATTARACRSGDRAESLPAARSPLAPFETLPERAMRRLAEGGTVRFDDRLIGPRLGEVARPDGREARP